MISRIVAGGLLLLVLAGTAQGQTDELEASLQSLDADVAALRAFSERLEAAPEADREVLRFRQDELSFAALIKLDQLVRGVAELPPDDPLRQEVEKRLREDLADAGQSVLQLVDGVNQRLAAYRAELESLSGASLVTTEAYISSLETSRLRYYEGLVDVVEGRKLMDMPADGIAAPLVDVLLLEADRLSGTLDFSGAALDEIQGRLQQDSANADLQAAAIDMGNRHKQSLQRLEEVTALLERLGADVAPYKALLIKQSDSISLQVLETGVIRSLVSEGWNTTREKLVQNGPDILVRGLIFIVILLVFRFLSRLTRRAVTAACERPGMDLSTLLKDVLVSVSGGTVMAIGFLMALSQIGISLGPMLAGLGIAGFVIGFALQDTLGNFAAGGMILIYRPYDVDDFVEVAGASGFVRKMSLVSTTITTFDNQTLVVPNSKIWGDVIKNVTAQKVRRVDMVFGIGYGDDVENAERILKDILDSHEKVLEKPESVVRVHELGDSSVNFAVRPWVRTEDYWDVYWDITREVKLRFDREGVSIPFPQRDVHLYQESS
jgi:small conductance mechanosensitive channel